MDIEKEILSIKERNHRVEEDKAWETSLARKALVAILTYAVVVVLLVAANIPHPYMGAVVPTGAFLLSTLSLPWFKEIWKHLRKK